MRARKYPKTSLASECILFFLSSLGFFCNRAYPFSPLKFYVFRNFTVTGIRAPDFGNRAQGHQTCRSAGYGAICVHASLPLLFCVMLYHMLYMYTNVRGVSKEAGVCVCCTHIYLHFNDARIRAMKTSTDVYVREAHICFNDCAG